MHNSQKFNIINPKRVSCGTLHERADMPPLWRRCLRYRPRVKDLRVLMLPRDRVREMRCSCHRGNVEVPTTCVPHCASKGDEFRGQKSKTLIFSESDTRKDPKASNAFNKTSQTSGLENHLFAPNPVPLTKHTGPKLLDPSPSPFPTNESKVEAANDELGIGIALSSVYDTNYDPHQSYTPAHPNHEIGMALTTSDAIFNYSSSQQDTHSGDIHKQSDKAVRGSARSNNMSSWEISQIDKDTRSKKSEVSTRAGLVDIPTLVPEYSRPEKESVTTNIVEDKFQYQPLPYSASTHRLMKVLKVEAARQEQEEMDETGYREWQKLRKPRDSRRCGQVWDGEETRNSSLAIEALNALSRPKTHLSHTL
ncbi:hypothetical protein SBOR_0983 [Sclerotinia borealis F-4128]|uniref:Uncharacterized protein n=1 Tax=Sclerotinia borealis (strain F-4128) TaxID=1432307 RepID=W9CR97_SCLBF|nr:hypothetical protein SBOR_0983 [Sclerotinia borealis F-4128]